MIKSLEEKNCDLSWLDRPYKCVKKNKDEVEQYAKDCNIDLELFKTKADRCRELYKKQNPSGSPKKVRTSPKKSSKKPKYHKNSKKNWIKNLISEQTTRRTAFVFPKM